MASFWVGYFGVLWRGCSDIDKNLTLTETGFSPIILPAGCLRAVDACFFRSCPAVSLLPFVPLAVLVIVVGVSFRLQNYIAWLLNSRKEK